MKTIKTLILSAFIISSLNSNAQGYPYDPPFLQVVTSFTYIYPPLVVGEPTCYNNNNIGIASASGEWGGSPYTYSWSTGATTSSIECYAGTYTITVMDWYGEVISASVVNPVYPAQITITSTSTNATICPANGTITALATGGIGSLTYSWNTGATGATVSEPHGTYTVVVTDSNGCQNTKVATIGLSPCPKPGKGDIKHGIDTITENNSEIVIFDITGRAVRDYKASKIPIETGLPNGVYYYTLIKNGNVVGSRKIVIVK